MGAGYLIGDERGREGQKENGELEEVILGVADNDGWIDWVLRVI